MYSREIFMRAKEELDARREAAGREAAEREAALHASSPELSRLDAELAGTGLKIFRAAVAGRDIAPIREENARLMSERADLLRSLGYAADYTDPHYACQKCSDSGYTTEGKMCSCLRELIFVESVKASGIGRLIERQSFDNFDLGWYAAGEERERMERNLGAAKSFAEGFSEANGANLLFVGKTGTGKTHLSTAIAKLVIERGFSVLYDSAQNIISAFEKDKFRSGYARFEAESEKYLEADLLILDDLGAEFSNQFTVSCLYNLLNTRQNKCLSTIVSTNLSPEELSAKYEDRIFSRLVGAETSILLFSGKDHRLG